MCVDGDMCIDRDMCTDGDICIDAPEWRKLQREVKNE
jgi:hypothetical protein